MILNREDVPRGRTPAPADETVEIDLRARSPVCEGAITLPRRHSSYKPREVSGSWERNSDTKSSTFK